jgi:biotin carboxyl carrier protein
MKLKSKNTVFDIDLKVDSNNLLLDYDNKSLSYKINEVNSNTYSVASESSKKTAYYHKEKNNIFVNIDGFTYTFEILDDDSFNDFSSNEDKNIDIIKSPMPGSVIKVLVNNGDEVEEGNPLIIIEAMKMETTLYSSINGKITEINVSNGEQVSPDKELIKIEKNN